MAKLKLDEDEFKHWIKTQHNIDFDSAQSKKSYETNVNSVHRYASNNRFFLELGPHFQEWENIYNKGKNFSLCTFQPGLDNIPVLVLNRKEFSSMVNKSYRFNYVNNEYFEESPIWPLSSKKEWLTPDNWFQEINDTVRSKIVCNYVDGPQFLAHQLVNWADECGLKKRIEPKQKEEGYYAYHFYVKIMAPIIENGIFEDREVEVEIQLASQLQDALYQITHKVYDKTRVKKKSNSDSWKWDLKSQTFRVSYMSHTLHLLEAFILDIRNRIYSTKAS